MKVIPGIPDTTFVMSINDKVAVITVDYLKTGKVIINYSQTFLSETNGENLGVVVDSSSSKF